MSRITNILYFAILLSGLSSCIDYFHPDLSSQTRVKYVVDGQITDQEGFQNVYISTTSTMEKPDYSPLSFCNVKIIDDNGNVFKLDENIKERGCYRIWLEKEYLKPGTSYQVKIVTASGIEIVSDFDQMSKCPEIDSIYYLRKDYPTSDPNVFIEGIQFYVDIDKKNTNSQFFKWDIDETWEHHATQPITWYNDPAEGWVKDINPKYIYFTCWTTERLKKLFTLSTENITQSKFTMKPLHYVDNLSQRLTFCYSVLIKQQAISEPAFRYWDALRKNSEEQGGLYNTQPLNIKGNLRSTTNPELEILGYFSAYSVRSKRIFVQKLENFDVCKPVCAPPYLEDPEKPEEHKYEIEISGVRYILPDACVECFYMSGSTVKPNFWPY